MQPMQKGEGRVQEGPGGLRTEVLPRTAGQDPYYRLHQGSITLHSTNTNLVRLTGCGDAAGYEWPDEACRA